MSAPTILLRLPLELLLAVSDHLSTRDLSLFSRTCHTLHARLSRPLNKRFSEEATSILFWGLEVPWLPSVVKRALASGANPNSTNPNSTNTGANPHRYRWYNDHSPALFVAVALNNLEAAAMLLEAGADVNAKDTSMDRTPMYYAELWSFEEMAQLLASFGAERITP